MTKLAPATSPDFRLIDLACRAENCCRLINLAVQTASRRQSVLSFPAVDADGDTSSIVSNSRQSRSRAASVSDTARRCSLTNEDGKNGPLFIFCNIKKKCFVESEYVDVMKALQIASFKFIGDFGKLAVPFAFAKEAKALNAFSPALKERCRRIGRELASLHNALPLCFSNSIFICVDESEILTNRT